MSSRQARATEQDLVSNVYTHTHIIHTRMHVCTHELLQLFNTPCPSAMSFAHVVFCVSRPPESNLLGNLPFVAEEK